MKKSFVFFSVLIISICCGAQQIQYKDGQCTITNNLDEPIWVWWDKYYSTGRIDVEYLQQYFCRRNCDCGDFMSIFNLLTDSSISSGNSGEIFLYKILAPGDYFKVILHTNKKIPRKSYIRKHLFVIPDNIMNQMTIYRFFYKNNIAIFNYQMDTVLIYHNKY